MKIISRVALAGVFALGLGAAAQAQTYSPKVPDFAHPNPENPIATNGTPLPHSEFNEPGVYSGRSAYVGAGPIDGPVGLGLGVAGDAVDTGLGVAGGAVDTGLSSVDATGRGIR